MTHFYTQKKAVVLTLLVLLGVLSAPPTGVRASMRDYFSQAVTALRGALGVAVRPTAPALSTSVQGQRKPAMNPSASTRRANGAEEPSDSDRAGINAIAAVLYDQINNASGNSTNSQNYEATYDTFDNEGADDFVVPAGRVWTIDTVNIRVIDSTTGAFTANVTFYANSGTNFPAAAVCTRTALPVNVVNGTTTIPLGSPCALTQGTYWVGVQINMNFDPNSDQVFWESRTTQSNSGGVWRNPGDGFGSGCTNFDRKANCGGNDTANPDWLFSLEGTDTQACTITCPANITVSNTPGACSAVVAYPAPTTTGVCGTVTCTPNSGSNFPVGVTTVTCNTTGLPRPSCTFTITVQDTQAPTVTVGTIASCYPTVAAAQAAALAATTATDICPGALVETASTVGTCSAVVTIRTTDIAGNFTDVTYNTRIDNTPPTVTVGSIASCYLTVAAAEAAALAATTATDNCPGALTETASTVGTCSAVITVTTTDSCGNATAVTYNTRIDNTPPTVTAGSIAACYSTVAAAEAAALAVTSATDNCPGALTEVASTVGTCSAVITVTTTDGCGNATAVTYNTRIDNTPPTVTIGSIASCYLTVAAAEAAALAATTATDNCPGALTETASTVGTCSAVITVTTTDVCGNATAVTYNTRIDNTPPTVTVGSIASSFSTVAAAEAAALAATTATDNCPGALTETASTVGTCSAVITVTTTDGCGNATAVTYNTIIDATPPTITCPSNQTAFSASGNPIPVTFPAPTAADNCPGVTVTCVPASGANFAVGVTTVTCTASDASSSSPDATCSFTVTVNSFTPAPTLSLVDPLNCNGPGDVINGSVTLVNPTAFAQTGTVTVALPAGIVGLPGTCVSSIATCTTTATTVSWSGTIPANTTLTITSQAQFANNVAAGTVLCTNTTAVFNGITGTAQGCLTVNCPVVGPGGLPGPLDALSDQKAGSVLVYNLVSSSASNPASQNSRISITNVNPSRTAYVHLFFVDGSNCSVADSFLCLTPNQTAAFLHSDIDPGTTGYVVAVATDRNGCPTNFNTLIGDEYVKLSSGHAANLGAEAIPALVGSAFACNAQSNQATLNFDGVMYGMLPRMLALSNFGSRLDGNNTLLVVNRIGGNLATGAATLGTLFGQLYDDAEKLYSFSLPASGCQLRGSLSDSFPRTTPRIDQVVSSGRSGWLKLAMGTDGAILGAALNANTNAASSGGAFNQGHNLHKLTLTTTASVTIPVFPPTC